MSKNLIKAIVRSSKTLELNVSKEFYISSMSEFRLYCDDIFVKNLKAQSKSESNSSVLINIKVSDITFIPGKKYDLATKDNFFIPIDFSYLSQTKEFDEKYRYDGPLGAVYSPKKTSFSVFSPFATSIVLNISQPNGIPESFLMKHDFSTGVFSLSLSGDYEKARYTYLVTIFGRTREVVDPYAFSVDANSRHGFVIDANKIVSLDNGDKFLPQFSDRKKAIIYEINVRDMTSKTGLANRGTYSALSQKGLTDEHWNPLGLDYLASLGVSHIQVMPTLDFQTVDDLHPFESYNWGYDPLMFFTNEGSYSSDPNDPYCRILELREMVKSFHSSKMRVVSDVVYNHVYSSIFNPLNILVPGYYFRQNADRTNSNGSGCGNDIESRHYMVRRLIVDSLCHAVKFYGFDGFRFDLMGIVDVKTLLLAEKELKALKNNILLYGEGWDLWTNLPSNEKGSSLNAGLLKDYSFFNDRFRDVVKGKTNESELTVKGYLLGDSNYIDGFKHVMLGSSLPMAFAPMFENPGQSVNYVECHDNHTLFDKIQAACPNECEDFCLKRIKMITMAVLFASGIPFFHAGQEIGQSKNMKGNTYNAGDELNGFDYSLLNQRYEMHTFFQDAIKAKKRFISFCGNDYDSMQEHTTFTNLENNALMITYDLSDCVVYLIFNPVAKTFLYSFDDDVKLIFNEMGDVYNKDFYVRLAIVNSLSALMFISEKKK